MRIHTMQGLRRGDRVKITFESGKIAHGAFVSLVNDHEKKGAHFTIDGMSDLLFLFSTELQTLTLETE